MQAALVAPESPCPCGRQDRGRRALSFGHCCGRFIGGSEPAPDAESLMRSRYSAYVLGHEAYLLSTWHRSTRPVSVAPEPGLKWLGLDVRSHRRLDGEHAEVEFVARSRLQGRAHRMQERSRFVREAGVWYYVDGSLA